MALWFMRLAVCAAAIGVASSSSTQAQNFELGGKICAGSLSSANGPGGASAIAFVRGQNGELSARLYFSPGQAAKEAMMRAVAAGTPDIRGLRDLGDAARVQVTGHIVTFERHGPDPRTGAQVVFRSFRFEYTGGSMNGTSAPVNDVMEDGRPGATTHMLLTCLAGQR